MEITISELQKVLSVCISTTGKAGADAPNLVHHIRVDKKLSVNEQEILAALDSLPGTKIVFDGERYYHRRHLDD